MCFLNQNFKLTKEMIDSNKIDEMGGDTYFIPINLSEIPVKMIHGLNYFDLIDEIYITAMYDLSGVSITSHDVFGQAYPECWNPTNAELEIISAAVGNES